MGFISLPATLLPGAPPAAQVGARAAQVAPQALPFVPISPGGGTIPQLAQPIDFRKIIQQAGQALQAPGQFIRGAETQLPEQFRPLTALSRFGTGLGQGRTGDIVQQLLQRFSAR